jgi:hypothetical protein
MVYCTLAVQVGFIPAPSLDEQQTTLQEILVLELYRYPTVDLVEERNVGGSLDLHKDDIRFNS